ncbi:MAG: hypothetical protein IPP74_13035 [Alphaproteobacteria bacterium]|nr:hypothetical protein [Alphaproteobacteria bacterium]
MSFDTIAKTYVPGATAPATSTLTPATTTSPMDSFTGVVQEGGSVIVITEANIKFDNKMDRRFVIGSKDTLRSFFCRENFRLPQYHLLLRVGCDA